MSLEEDDKHHQQILLSNIKADIIISNQGTYSKFLPFVSVFRKQKSVKLMSYFLRYH